VTEETIDWVLRANAKAKGKRPQYFDEPATDRVLSMLLALVGEVSVLRERLDTIERLLEQQNTLQRADIETFTPDRQAAFERGCRTREYIARIMRGVQQDMEAIAADEPPVDEVRRELLES
jgi:ABC-type phosphate/phosphonate transport system ATPase subunit